MHWSEAARTAQTVTFVSTGSLTRRERETSSLGIKSVQYERAKGDETWVRSERLRLRRPQARHVAKLKDSMAYVG